MNSLVNRLNESLGIVSEAQIEEDSLYSAISNGIINFSFDRSIGPSHYPHIVELGKKLKKEIKAPMLLSMTNKKPNPALLGDIFANLAAQVNVDYSLDIESRVSDVESQISELIRKKYGIQNSHLDDDGFDIIFDLDPVVKKYNKRSGSKEFSPKKGIALTILVNYKSGKMSINISPSAKLFQ